MSGYANYVGVKMVRDNPELAALLGVSEEPQEREKLIVPIPEKGNPASLQEWIKFKIKERGLTIKDLMPYGFQQELILLSYDYGYKDSSAVKRAWGVLKLESAKK